MKLEFGSKGYMVVVSSGSRLDGCGLRIMKHFRTLVNSMFQSFIKLYIIHHLATLILFFFTFSKYYRDTF